MDTQKPYENRKKVPRAVLGDIGAVVSQFPGCEWNTSFGRSATGEKVQRFAVYDAERPWPDRRVQGTISESGMAEIQYMSEWRSMAGGIVAKLHQRGLKTSWKPTDCPPPAVRGYAHNVSELMTAHTTYAPVLPMEVRRQQISKLAQQYV